MLCGFPRWSRPPWPRVTCGAGRSSCASPQKCCKRRRRRSDSSCRTPPSARSPSCGYTCGKPRAWSGNSRPRSARRRVTFPPAAPAPRSSSPPSRRFPRARFVPDNRSTPRAPGLRSRGPSPRRRADRSRRLRRSRRACHPHPRPRPHRLRLHRPGSRLGPEGAMATETTPTRARRDRADRGQRRARRDRTDRTDRGKRRRTRSRPPAIRGREPGASTLRMRSSRTAQQSCALEVVHMARTTRVTP